MEIKISRKTALDLMKPIEIGRRTSSLMEHLGLEWIMCKEYDTSENGYDEEGRKLWAGIDSSDYDTIKGDSRYRNFAIWT